jgi:DNA repair photolyase
LGEEMPLNIAQGNMYEWVTHTWNPIKGCQFGCQYCYIKSNRLYSLKPRFQPKELNTNLGKGNFIFVGSMADMFGDWIPDSWILDVLKHCKKFDNQYLFQSKNPLRFHEFLKDFPDKVILGTTIETNRDIKKISKAPSPQERTTAMRMIQLDKEVTVEPIIDFDMIWMIQLIKDCNPKFVAIGADSKNHNLDEPKPWKIETLIDELKMFTDVKLKNNLKRLYEK